MSLGERGHCGGEVGAADVEGDQIAGHLERFGKSFREQRRKFPNFWFWTSGTQAQIAEPVSSIHAISLTLSIALTSSTLSCRAAGAARAVSNQNTGSETRFAKFSSC